MLKRSLIAILSLVAILMLVFMLNPLMIAEAQSSSITITSPTASSSPSSTSDYATKELHNPWDFEDSADVRSTWNLTSISYANGAFSAINTSNDPCFALHENGNIDTNKYHILVFDYAYDGPFDLSDAGGTIARFTWKVKDSNDFQQTLDIITPPNRQTYTIDLKTYPLAPRRDTIGWNGIVNFVRFDPHEGWNPKRFYLYDMKLLSSGGTDTTTSQVIETSGVFNIQWNENSSNPVGNVSIYYDTNNSGTNGVLITSNAPNRQGANSYAWNTKTAPGGTYYIYIVAGGSVVYSNAAVKFKSSGGVSGIDHKKPKIKSVNDSPDPFVPSTGQSLAIGFSLTDNRSSTFTVNLTITDRMGNLIASLGPYTLYSGSNTLTWDGKNSSGTVVSPGKYRYIISATDEAGNNKTKKGKVTVN
jgi:flagellar hook assembly protein FlgD